MMAVIAAAGSPPSTEGLMHFSTALRSFDAAGMPNTLSSGSTPATFQSTPPRRCTPGWYARWLFWYTASAAASPSGSAAPCPWIKSFALSVVDAPGRP
jgi:hypothetical protein